ncbi:DinB family protein [Ornithinibacillus sp. 4-3]|uniref:DinB family protein n=1 Tax=Ornithinibacillus sp. 4-3 TaxID=3231488 RepID=A0AB39HQY4_9BACI
MILKKRRESVMGAVSVLRDELLAVLELGIRTMEGLLQKVKEKDWNYRPAENMRNLQELAIHIISISEVDLHLWQEKDQETIQNLEASYEQIESTKAMIGAMHKGFQQYKTYMVSLSDEELLTKKTKPFYLERGKIQAHWLVEEISHFFHHRGQFLNSLAMI